MRLSALVPLFALSIIACGAGPSPEEPAPPPPPIEATSFMNDYATALCDHAARCSLTASYLDARCNENVRSLFGEDVEAAIAAGRIVYDAEAAGACVAGLRSMDCLAEQPSDATLAACFKALQGTVATDKPCFGTFECESGVCRSVTGDTCPTVCQAVANVGDACSLISGPECDTRKGLRCSGGSCVAPVGAQGACVDNFGCQSGLVCVANKCVPLRAEGYGCSQDSSCVPGTFCAAGGDEGGLCEARVPEGGDCSQDSGDTNAAFRLVQCQEGLLCKGGGLTAAGMSVTGKCAKPAEEGESCTVEPDGFQLFGTGCRFGLVCNAGKCEKPPAIGQACGAHFLCQDEGAYCDVMTNVCTQGKANGEACMIDPECAGGYCGSMGTCVDLDSFCGP